MPGSLPLTRTSFSGTPGLLLAIGFSCCPPLMAATAWALCSPARAQATPPGLQRPSDMDGTSPLSAGSGLTVPSLGVPLGSTEIATPGISPPAAPSGAGSILGNTRCSSFTILSQSAGRPFDGGGLSEDASATCAPTKGLEVPGPVTSRPSLGRAGVPLGSTELGGAGLSSVALVPAPSGYPFVSSQPTGTPPCQDASASSSVTAGSGGC
jgi:hypothetical protein